MDGQTDRQMDRGMIGRREGRFVTRRVGKKRGR